MIATMAPLVLQLFELLLQVVKTVNALLLQPHHLASSYQAALLLRTRPVETGCICVRHRRKALSGKFKGDACQLRVTIFAGQGVQQLAQLLL